MYYTYGRVRAIPTNRVYRLNDVVQWIPSIVDTLGTAENVLISEVPSFQG